MAVKHASNNAYASCRPAAEKRCFESPAVEEAIREVSSQIKDREVAWLFANCLPNTLDTTVSVSEEPDGRPDTFVITGDIPAMWLRDSTNQVWPYLPFVNQDPKLNRLIQGVINRQTRCVLMDPYANAFYAEPKLGEWAKDLTDMKPGIHERKYELDSLCAVLRLACGYYQQSKDTSCFDKRWLQAVELMLETIRVQQAGSDEEPKPAYLFQRMTPMAKDTLMLEGRGQPARRCGMSKSPFRPSDDAASLPFLVPANAMAVTVLRQVAGMLREIGIAENLAARAAGLAEEIDQGIKTHAIVEHPKHGKILAYEVDGFGSWYFMDDANVPSLVSLAYLGYFARGDELYRRTRAFCLSPENPYFFQGSAASGVGGPHIGLGWIWPMSLIMRALTSESEQEIVQCLSTLKSTHAGSGFMHEAFWKDNPRNFTRSWFAWANTLFGELILTLYRQRPELLKSRMF